MGCLVKKQLTTPQQYPLTLNALVAACNQTSNRNPVVSYDERTVERAVTSLKGQGLLRFVHPSHGRSATRYRQVLDEVLGLDTPKLALLAVLLLHGPQTPGELRARAARMAPFADPHAVERELGALAGGDDPLVVRLPREPGRKELRWSQRITGDPEVPSATAGAGLPDDAVDLSSPPAPSLAEEVAALRAEVAALRRDLDEVLARLQL